MVRYRTNDMLLAAAAKDWSRKDLIREARALAMSAGAAVPSESSFYDFLDDQFANPKVAKWVAAALGRPSTEFIIAPTRRRRVAA